MNVITCATCGQAAEPHSQWGRVVICGACGETLIVGDDGVTRKAMGADMDKLSPEALAHLRLGLRGFRSVKRAAR